MKVRKKKTTVRVYGSIPILCLCLVVNEVDVWPEAIGKVWEPQLSCKLETLRVNTLAAYAARGIRQALRVQNSKSTEAQ